MDDFFSKKWTKEEIQNLINQEHPLISAIRKYTYSDLRKEDSQFKMSTMYYNESSKRNVILYECKLCGKMMPEENRDLHAEKYCTCIPTQQETVGDFKTESTNGLQSDSQNSG